MEQKILKFNEHYSTVINIESHEINVLLSKVITNFKNLNDSVLARYSNIDDARIMLFRKILHSLCSYQLELALLNGFFIGNEQNIDLVKKAGVNGVFSIDKFLISYESYLATNFYINLFSCIESSLRIFHKSLNLQNSRNGFISFEKIHKELIEDLTLHETKEYNQLLTILTIIRNLMHNMGLNDHHKGAIINYKGKDYDFKAKSIPDYELLKITNILLLINDGVKNLLEEVLNSEKITNIVFIQDNLSSDFEKYLSYQTPESLPSAKT